MRSNPIILPILIAGLLCIRAGRAAEPETLALIDRGVELFDYGRWNDARHEFLRAQQGLAPDDRYERQKVEFYLAACAVELGDRDAEGALKGFVERWPGSVFGNDVLFSLASYYCTAGDMAAAARTFAEVDYRSLGAQRKAQYDVRMGYAAFCAGRYDEAYGYFDRVEPRSEYADHALYYKSYIDYARGDYDRAKLGFNRLASSDAYAPLVPYYLLQLEFMEGDYDYVVREGDALAAKAAPRHRTELERVLAESWYHLGDYDKTVGYLSAYRRDGGDFGRNEEYLMGYSLYRTARYADAEGYLRRACGADDALTQNASYHLADCCIRRGAKREAMQSFAMAANDAFDASIAEDALFNYGKLQYELGGGVFNEAINLLTRYIERHSLIAPHGRGATAARGRLLQFAQLRRRLRSPPVGAFARRGAARRLAEDRLLPRARSVDRRRPCGRRTAHGRIRCGGRESQIQCARALLAGRDGLCRRRLRCRGEMLRRLPETRSPQRGGVCAGVVQPRLLPFFGGADARGRRGFLEIPVAPPHGRRLPRRCVEPAGRHAVCRPRFRSGVGELCEGRRRGRPAKYYAQYQRAVTLGILHEPQAKIEALRGIIAAGEGDYADDASYELGRTYIAAEQYAEGARALERFVADYPSSPMRTQALADLGLAWLNLGDEEKSLAYYDRVVSAAPQSAEAKGALEGIRDIYVSRGDADAYFAYAERAGLESDVTLVARDSLTFAAAQQLYLARQDGPAARALADYAERFPKGYYLTDALYYLSDTYLRLGQRDEAVATLAALADRSPNAHTATALARLAEMTRDDGRYAEAASAYRRLYDAVGEPKARSEAMTGYVRATLAEGDPAKIAPMAADVAASADAGAVAVRESQFALAEQLREGATGRKP